MTRSVRSLGIESQLRPVTFPAVPPVLSKDPLLAPATLGPAEREILEFFVQLGRFFSLPRSVGEIYGLLFATGEPLTLDDLVLRLGISKGSASQGLRVLRGAQAVRVRHRTGDRKDYYEAELELPSLAKGFLRDHLHAKLEQADQRLDHLREVVEDPRNLAPEGLRERVARLRAWHGKARRLLPLLSAFLKL
jgi:HTH-type transcriptional regulator, glycine betaine synthesis regulator